MDIDEALEKAFDQEVQAFPDRRPGAEEVLGACDRVSSGYSRAPGHLVGDFMPIAAMVAAVLIAVFLDPASMSRLRPLASELVLSIPDGAGSRFMDFVLEAGESYRSID